MPLRIELIVVDDCSTDGTRDLLARPAAETSGSSSCCSRPTRGKGAGAAPRASRPSPATLVVIQDADLEYSPEGTARPHRPSFARAAPTSSMARASSGTHRVFLFTHYLGNLALTFLTNLHYNTMLSDMETCYKLMRTSVLRSMTPGIERVRHRARADGQDLQARVCASTKCPISYDGRGYDEGKKIGWRDGVVAVWVLLKCPVHRVNGFLRLLEYARPHRVRLGECARGDGGVRRRLGGHRVLDQADLRQGPADRRVPRTRSRAARRPSTPEGHRRLSCRRI